MIEFVGDKPHAESAASFAARKKDPVEDKRETKIMPINKK